MRNKVTDEYKTQLNITNRLNKIVDTEDRFERKKIKHELRDLTHGFWYQKYKKIREIIESKDSSDNKCFKIKKALDTPKNAIDTL